MGMLELVLPYCMSLNWPCKINKLSRGSTSSLTTNSSQNVQCVFHPHFSHALESLASVAVPLPTHACHTVGYLTSVCLSPLSKRCFSKNPLSITF